MNRSYERIEAFLALDRFPFPVAMFPGRVDDLGDIIEIHAFDVPESEILAVSHRLNRLLADSRAQPLALGTAFLSAESAVARGHVPESARWWSLAAESAVGSDCARWLGALWTHLSALPRRGFTTFDEPTAAPAWQGLLTVWSSLFDVPRPSPTWRVVPGSASVAALSERASEGA